MSKFDGFRESEPRSCVKPTAVPSASPHYTANNTPETGGATDVILNAQDAAADWSGFAPKHASGRRRMDWEPAAHKETIARSEEHGIVPALDAETHDSVRPRRRHYAQPGAQTGDHILIGGPSAPEPGERFITCARAASAGEPTPVELKSEEWRCQRTAGKKHGTPAYHSSGRCHPDRRQVAGDRLRAFRLGQVAATHSAGDAQDVTENILGSRARAANGPGSLLNGLGREVVESSDLFRNRNRTRRGDVQQPGAKDGAGTTYVGFRNKELFAINYNPHVAGYTGHQPRRL